MHPSSLTHPARAFTLVELLGVMAVLALLIALALPALTRVRTAGQNAKCLSNLRQIAQADFAYRNNYKDIPPRDRVQLDDFSNDLDWLCPTDHSRALVYDYRPFNSSSKIPSNQTAATNFVENSAGFWLIAVDPMVSLSPPRSPHGARINAAFLDGHAGVLP